MKNANFRTFKNKTAGRKTQFLIVVFITVSKYQRRLNGG